jgi:hypothetical protein
MPVIARDAVASDHLVYAWPFPIGPEEYEVACAEDELVVMCPSWMVGDRLGPGRHRWRTPDPTRPSSAYFVLTAPVEVGFDMITQFVLPMNGQPVRIRASGSLQVRCLDPALLVAQFVGLPFDHVNEGVLRSVSRSIERMLSRLLTRRLVHANTPHAITDPAMQANIIEELVAYNPAAGAVFGVELVRFGHLSIVCDDGSRPWQEMVAPPQARHAGPNGETERRVQAPTIQPPMAQQPAEPNLLETVRATKPPGMVVPPPPIPPRTKTNTSPPPIPQAAKRPQSQPGPDGRPSEAAGEIQVKNKATMQGHSAAPKLTPPGPVPIPTPPPGAVPAEGTPNPQRVITTPAPGAVPAPRRAGAVEVQSTDEPTQPGVDIVRSSGGASIGSGVVGGEIDSNKKKIPTASSEKKTDPEPRPAQSAQDAEPRGAILGIGMGHIGSGGGVGVGVSKGVASGEISQKIAPGGRVLVPGPNGLMQSATVRNLVQGYYELEVGGSGETIWVPITGVVPE